MSKLRMMKLMLAGGASVFAAIGGAHAAAFDIPGGDLRAALREYSSKTGIELLYLDAQLTGVRTSGAKGDLTADAALTHILSGTGFVEHRHAGGAVAVVPAPKKSARGEAQENELSLADAAPTHAAASVETVVVTSSKIKGDIQTVPIAITALSQEQLTSRQIAGGPDLVKEVPNLTFSKTNFTGYNIEIRGIGTQAISVTTDPAVAVAFNDIPFLRNHFFEQEFYDVSQVEVLRGPQGTLYGRNATAGVVNVISAKPTDQFEAMLSADIGNYHNRRYEGMVNVPIVDDRLDLRVAGEWTKRDGYSFNTLTNKPIDGRDLWSSRVTLGIKPWEDLHVELVWEHFQESDGRLRTAKQLCKTAPIPSSIEGVPLLAQAGHVNDAGTYLSQGCLPVSLYSPDAFEVPNGYVAAYYAPLFALGQLTQPRFNIYAATVQSRNLRDIESAINPIYKAKNDTLELNADYQITPTLTFTSQTGYNNDFLWSTEDYNRFNSAPGAFRYHAYQNGSGGTMSPDPSGLGHCEQEFCGSVPMGGVCTPSSLNDEACNPDAVFCDPQLGCSDRLVLEDLSDERAWQLSQEFRLSSNFSGPLNFSIGGNYLHYETDENYYVFINSLTAYLAAAAESYRELPSYVPGVSDNSQCLRGGFRQPNTNVPEELAVTCAYIDPNPLTKLNNQGHNYYLNQNPYVLNSYAGFGEVYYNVAPDLKLIGGLRWTDDQKHFLDIPSELFVGGYGYSVTKVIDQQWNQWTGRAAVNWSPKLDFTDQSLIYGSYARGYKAGGANPPGPVFGIYNSATLVSPIHPLTFKPEFVNAYELGTKNTLLDGSLTLNGDLFYYDYKNYQISRIVDRTAINDNFNARVHGAELEANWEPVAGLKLAFAGGYENATLDKGDSSIDLMDRTAGMPGWMVVKPNVSQASNCILPAYVLAEMVAVNPAGFSGICLQAYSNYRDPLTLRAYTPYPAPGYPGFDPLAGTPGDPYTGQNYDPYLGIDVGPAPNNGEGFAKDLSGNQLPNAPHFTTSLSADYTIPVSEDWAATAHTDFYWQSQSWARVFNDRPYDKLRGYSNVNLALILTSASGWQVMGYLKNVFNTTAITGDFLNSDDTGLTTNVFLTDPRLFGVRVTKNW